MKSLAELILVLSIILVDFIIIMTFALLGLIFAEALFPHINFIEKFLVLGTSLFLSAFIVVRGIEAAIEAAIETKSPGG